MFYNLVLNHFEHWEKINLQLRKVELYFDWLGCTWSAYVMCWYIMFEVCSKCETDVCWISDLDMYGV